MITAIYRKMGARTLVYATLAVVLLALAPVLSTGQIKLEGASPPPNQELFTNEAKSLLASIAESQINYFAANNVWAGYPGNDKVFQTLGWKPTVPTHYAYYCGSEYILPKSNAYPYDYPDPAKNWPFGLYPDVTLSDFVCMAIGNNDTDSYPDVWMINKFKRPAHLIDDASDKILVDVVGAPFDASRFFAEALSKENPTSPTRIYIEINLAAYRLDLFEDGRRLKSYPIAIGMMGYKTPVRDFHLERIEWNPWWIPPDAEWCQKRDPETGEKTGCKPQGPGPGNPLGPVKMVLQNSILMHGTNKPSSIGKKASHSCMRMHSDNAAELAWKIMILAGTRQPIVPRELYRDKSRRTYRLALLTDVQVTTVYRRTEVYDNFFMLHTDPYIRQPLTSRDIQERLTEFGLSSDSMGEGGDMLFNGEPKQTLQVPIKL